MRKVIAVILVFVVIIILSGLHIYKTVSLCNDIGERIDEVENLFSYNKWDDIENEMEKIYELWHSNRVWACLTLSTNQIDEIEISLEQAVEYTRLRSAPDFIGELKMFELLIEHLPKQEGLNLEELL